MKGQKLIWIVGALLIGVILLLIIRFYLFGYLNSKENNLVHYTDGTSQIYILGTIHNNHFTDPDYSMAEIQSAIAAIQPDLLLVEVRQKTVDQFGALDGPIDMIFAWSYAESIGMKVQGIDWWVLDENTQSNATSTERDDHMYENIISALDGEQTVLIIVGNAHRVEQGKRFARNGFSKVTISDFSEFFGHVSETDFHYPPSMAANIENKLAWVHTGMVADIQAAFTEESADYETWMAQADNMSGSLRNILEEYILPNRLR